MNNTSAAVNQIYENDDYHSDNQIKSDFEGVYDEEIDDMEVYSPLGNWMTREMLFSSIFVDMNTVDNKMLN